MRLWDALTAGPFDPGGLRCWVGDRYEQTPWPEVVRDAERMTAGIKKLGVTSGASVAAVLTNTPTSVRGLLAIWLAGGTVASLPTPARGMNDHDYAEQLSAICRQLEPSALLCDNDLLGSLPADLTAITQTRSWNSLRDSGRAESSPPGRDDIAFIQYSSGSTRMPKGCMLTTRAIDAQIDLLHELIEPVRGREVGFSWLPLSHDMGMFGGLLSCWAHGSPFVMSTPKRFMFAPSTWFTDMAQFAATITGGPDTALRLAARALRPSRLPAPLRLRVCIVGSERVHAETLEFVTEKLQPLGCLDEVLAPAYGLAEAVVAVTGTPREVPPRHLVVDVSALADGRVQDADPAAPSATRIVSAGVPCHGVKLSSLDEDDQIAEIRVRSPSLASGYFGEPQLTREHFRDGELLTGDLGFVRDGHLYPLGRIDDVISVAGRTVYAREIEAAVDEFGPVRPGSTVLLEAPDRDRLVLALELRRSDTDARALAERCAAIAKAKVGVALDECMFLAKGSLPRTPSGKIQRHRCRQLLALDHFEPVATVNLRAVSVT